MGDWVLRILMGLLYLVGNVPDVQSTLGDWQILQNWSKTADGFYVLSAESNQMISQCQKTVEAIKEKFILFPQVIHGVHEIYADHRLVKITGDPTFKTASPFYEQTGIRCSELAAAKVLQWKVTSYSRFFARITEAPKIVDSLSRPLFFSKSINEIGAGTMIVLAFFALLIFYQRVKNELTFSVVFGALFFSFHLMNAANSSFGLTYSMLTAHKLADLSVWIAGLFFLNAFRFEKSLSNLVYRLFSISCLLAITVIAFGRTGDEIQMGTFLPMAPFLVCTANILIELLREVSREKGGNIINSVASNIKLFSILAFAGFGVSDVLHIAGVYPFYCLVSFGILGGILGLTVAVNREIANTYSQRDHLMKNLEEKVAEKTKHLTDTLEALRQTQGELIQSARLASLGTLSAGIAHEINNSINYVSGAIVPLERRVMKIAPEAEKVILTKLFSAIRDGTSLTVEIVKSLRNFTGLNQAAQKNVLVSEVVQSVLTILKSKMKAIQLEVAIEPGLTIFGSVVGLNQVVMNLVSNAVDAIPKEGAKISIRAVYQEQEVLISISDNGPGIPEVIRERIFDPFFTTKDVGQGTGLGLYIVKKEIEKQAGKIRVISESGNGTCFELRLPKVSENQEAIKLMEVS